MAVCGFSYGFSDR